MKLTDISPAEFFGQLEKHAAEIEELPAFDNANEKIVAKLVDKKISKVEKYIASHIVPHPYKLLGLLENVPVHKMPDKYYSKYGLVKTDGATEERYRLSRFNQSLKTTISYISITDSLMDPDKAIEVNSVIEKTDFVLNKLYKLFGDSSYSISVILFLNDIPFRDGETAEMAQVLFKKGYVLSDGEDYAKISVKGAAYIERKNKPKKETKKESPLDKKLDTILEQLTKLGYGQEVIFNEIEELRELQHKLSKKSWSQLLKGKLFDLAMKELINTDTASSVYDYLTGDSLKLLK
ncbi:hypothetical protein [Chitinophaga barathri]|uniref:Uncharacterized protein n=1 Tax=Chitinophaga barathri TaxID=1647451 RepID=A0A3N4MIF3_9BACT|nr:hypothetical protein [Chitinophaga barathri]RPD39850.1 hypothetical protein EG028_17125 [Chitinophaga barathri]